MRVGRVWMLVLVILVAAVADARKGAKVAVPQPHRADIVATFTSGFVSFDANGHSGSTTIKSGLISLSTDDPYCVASSTTPCRYTINRIDLTASDTSVDGTDVTGIHAVNTNAAVGAIDDGSGMRLTVPPGMTFNVSGRIGGSATAFTVTPSAPNLLSMVIDPQLQAITLLGDLRGTQEGFTLHLTILATSDAPFANLPPIANAGPDQHVQTGCYAMVALDKSGTTDPNGDAIYSYFSENGYSIGNGDQPIAMFPGTHRITLNAFDSKGARGTDDVTVVVEDDGTTPPVPGATLFAIRTPPNVPVDTTSLVATTSLVLKPKAASLGGATAVSFGATTTTLSPSSIIEGDLWSQGPVDIFPNASVTGFVHSPSTVSVQPNASIGGIDSSPSFTPPKLISWNAVIPDVEGDPVVVAQSQSIAIPPGNYGAIRVAPGGMLRLSAGTYSASSLTTEPRATLSIDDADGPVVLYLRGPLIHRGTILGSPKLLVATTSADVSGTWAGTLLVPDGDARLSPPPGQSDRGAVFAGSVALSGQLVQASFPWDAIRAGRSACAITPIVECVRQLGPGSYVARFDYRNEVTYASTLVPVGPANRFLPSPESRGQPTTFLAGLFSDSGKGAFEVPFDGRPLTWIVGGRSATASAASPPCP